MNGIADGGLSRTRNGWHCAAGLFLATVLGAGGLAAGAARAAAAFPLGDPDFDGDRRADPAVFCPAFGLWRIALSASGYATADLPFGGPGCLPLAPDYDGDRRADPAVFLPADGRLTVRLSSAGYAAVSLAFAARAALPVAADFDGDRKADPAVWSAAAGRWTVRLSSANYPEVSLDFGGPGWLPAAADYDGDGLADPAVIQPTTGWISARLSRSGYATVTAPVLGAGGAPADRTATAAWVPAPGDYDGDRLADPMLYGAATGTWQGRLSQSAYGPLTLAFGGVAWQAAPGDYDADGLTDPALFRASPAEIEIRFARGADQPGTFQQTNLVQAGATLQAAAPAADGAVGLLYGRRDPGMVMDTSRFQLRSHGGTVLSDEPVYFKDGFPFPGGGQAALLVDDAGAPHVFTLFYGSPIAHLYRTGTGWTNERFGAVSGQSGRGPYACRDASGNFHVLSVGWDSAAPDTLLLDYFRGGTGAWQAQTARLTVGTNRWLWAADLAVDAAGTAHALASVQYHPNDQSTWPGTLYYFSNAGGTWTAETAAHQTHASWDAFFPAVSLALDPAGRPAAAAWLKYNVLTGSDALSQLLVFRRAAPGSWSREMLADTADGYFGTDGGHFTGLYPLLAFDSAGTAHIMFSDLASSHVGGYESASVGQIRYARGTPGSWRIETLFRQSAARGERIGAKRLRLSTDGRGLDVLAVTQPGSNLVHFTSSRRTRIDFE